MPYNKFKEVVQLYSDANKTDLKRDMEKLTTINLESRLQDLGINTSCPACNSTSVVKVGKVNNIQHYRCKLCKKKFTLFSGTILEKTKWHWDIWIKVLEMTLNSYSLDKMLNVLESDYKCIGIDIKTIWLLRMKLIYAMASIPMPRLSGIVQVDETFIRESQKGSRHLESTLKGIKRKPRYGRRPSKYGVMGAEFATITTAIDNRGYCVCKVTCLGKLTPELFTDLFDEHFDNPAFLCSDANSVYKNYCNVKNIPHYEKPSNYTTIIENSGYETPDFSDPSKAKITQEKNDRILKKLYSDGIIDKITNRGYMTYEQFNVIKQQNSLSLARVNELHSDIKKYINTEMTNVSTKYLKYYIQFFAFRRNWRVLHGHYPSSTKDAEEIFIDILKLKINYTTSMINDQELELPKPTERYNQLLKSETMKARAATKNKYFKFNEEDGVLKFNRREYLNNLPKSKLHSICKECKLTHYKSLAHYCLVSLILKQPNIEDIIYKLLERDRNYKMDEEDRQAIADGKYIL